MGGSGRGGVEGVAEGQEEEKEGEGEERKKKKVQARKIMFALLNIFQNI